MEFDRGARAEEELVAIGNLPPRIGDEPLGVAFPLQHAQAVAGQVDRIGPDGERQPYRAVGEQKLAAMDPWNVLEVSAVQSLKSGARFAVIDDMVDADLELLTADNTAEGKRIIGLVPCARP